MKEGEPGEGKSFDSVNEIRFALESKSVTLHSKINYRIDGIDDEKISFETTPGRVLISEELPKNENVKFHIVNK